MSKKKQPPRARALRRKAERQSDKLREAREKLALLEPGGSPERPLEVSSASVIEPRAETETCFDCNLPMKCEEHAAVTAGKELLRVARLCCRQCGARRALYFRIVEPLLN